MKYSKDTRDIFLEEWRCDMWILSRINQTARATLSYAVTRIKGRLGSACFVGLEAPESARELRTTRTEPICPAGILLTRYQPLLNCIHVLESSVLPDTSSNWDSRKNRRTNVVIQYFRVLIISNILYLGQKYYRSPVLKIYQCKCGIHLRCAKILPDKYI